VLHLPQTTNVMRYLAAIGLVMLLGCGSDPAQSPKRKIEPISDSTIYACWSENGQEMCIDLHQVTVNGHDYFMSVGSWSSGFAHRGDCRNPIHKCPCD
jgi:hypothetical protein